MNNPFKHKNTDASLVSDQNDLDLIRQYTENYDRAYAAGDKAGQQAAHDAAEKIRAKYQYSGGVDGSDYIKLGGDAGGTNAPKTDTSWLDRLGSSSYSYDASGRINAALDALLGREKFSYDAESDPLYQQYRKQYSREADRSAENALGKAAVMTGGMPSTAAITASQQASDYQMSQMTDKIPELQQLAYGMYLDDVAADRADLNTLISMEDNNYNRWLDERDYLYQLARDQVGDQQYADQLAYQKARDAIEDERYDTEWQYQLQQAAQKAAGGSGSGGSSGGSTGGSAGTDTGNQGNLFALADEYAQKGGDPEDYIKLHWKEYGYSSQTAALSGYKVYQTESSWASDGERSEKSVTAGNFGKLDYDPDEGIFTWNGRRYSSLSALQTALESVDLSDEDYYSILRALKTYGFYDTAQ